MSTTTACRLPDPVATTVQKAVDESGILQSELVRRAIRYYIEQNPDGISAFASQPGRDQNQVSMYDPLEDV